MPGQLSVHDHHDLAGIPSFNFPGRVPDVLMSPLDVDRSAVRPPQWPINKRASFPSTSLSHVHISDALLRSPDNGATLVFMKKNLTDIGQEAAEELAKLGRESPDDEGCVERIALGYNRLAILPMEFALLSRLRYLNLKNNSFSVFPDVLTLIPSLDTLDISHNKIKRLPLEAGDLVNLRVFCFSRNKVTRLPAYLSKFHRLAVLEVERNPIEWPPKSIMERPSKFDGAEGAEDMKDWVRSVQRWMEEDTTRPAKGLDDSGYSEKHDLEGKLADSFDSWSRFPLNESDLDEGVTPHARTFSIESISSIAESEIETPSSSFGQPERPPPLHLGILQSYSTENSPTRSIESYLPSPADSDTFFDDHTTSSVGGDDTLLQQQQHARNASYAAGGFRNPGRANHLPGKKSMPDLRTAKLNFSKKVPDLPERAIPSTTNTPTRGKIADDYSIPSPLSQRQDSGSSVSSNARPITKPFFEKERVQRSPTRAVASMAFERNSYFRRLSTLPAATITNTIPKPLLCLIDSARSILFAVCQIYQTLEHYTIHAIDDRLSSVLRKVLDPASADMMQLINSLDRFDAMSRKMLPPPSVCRGVVESCKDTVAVFGKAVGVLSLQLKVIATGDDVRYLRSMLLVLYGAAAEISCAWQNMVPHIEAIKPLLHSKSFMIPSPNGTVTATGSSELYATSASTMATFQLEQPPLSSLRSSPSGGPRTARRHAGSFSSKDVEIGKKLPSYDEPQPMLRGVAMHTPTLRTPKRKATIASVTIGSPIPPSPLPPSSSASSSFTGNSSRAHHSRSDSLASLQASSSSASSSPNIPSKTTFLDLPSSSKTQVDREALHAVQEAVEVAPAVWRMVEELLGDVLETKADIRDCLEKARGVTQRLSENIHAMMDGDPSADRKSLRDDAHVFLKTVVQLSNFIKTYGGAHSAALRANMVKLTNSTEEFAILLHVSSFSPSSTPRPYSPMLSASRSQGSLFVQHEENKLTSSPSLSRSRSAQPPASLKMSTSPPQDGSRSALATQSFQIPVIRKIRGRETRIDVSDPG